MDEHFTLKARIRSANADAIGNALESIAPTARIRREGAEFLLEAGMDGISAKELNRALLSALRRIDKRTTLRTEWISGKQTQKFFDYVLKKTLPAP